MRNMGKGGDWEGREMEKVVGRGSGKWKGKGRRGGGVEERRVVGWAGGRKKWGIKITSCDGDFFRP